MMVKNYSSIFLLGKIICLIGLAILFQGCSVDQPQLTPSHSTKTATAIPTVTPIDIPTATIVSGFDGERAFQDIATQLDFGPRTLKSEAHDQTVSWMVNELNSADWDVMVQELPYGDYVIQNVIAKRGESKPWIILGAHYDSRFFADQDPNPENHKQPVPGANDGASGVAVLLEFARVFPAEFSGEIWLVLFDAEDNGNIPDWDWILGSQGFVEVMDGQPDAVVIVDMVGDADQNIYWEKNSDPVLTREIWQVAENLGYADRFISRPGYGILDDHTPFLRAGIPAVDIIDFDYPAFHTTGDTLDKVSAKSLKVVGDVLYHWILTKVSIESSP